jgi:hypothetical protein
VTEREFPRKYTAVEERKIKKHRKKKSKNWSYTRDGFHFMM